MQYQLINDPSSGLPYAVQATAPDGSIQTMSTQNRAYLAWVAEGGVPTPAEPAPTAVPTCLLWQLQAVLTGAQWAAVQSAVAALDNPALAAFLTHGGNVIPANSTTLAQLAAAIGVNPSTLPALVAQASLVSIP